MGQRLASVRKTYTSNPLYYKGIRVTRIVGAAPEGEGQEQQQSGEQSSGEGGSGNSSGTEGSEGSEGEQQGQVTEDPKDLAERLRRTEERMKAADRRATEAEKKAKEYEDKDKSELERATGRVKELEESVSTKDKEIRGLRLQNAFLASNDITWHDPDLAVQHADLSEVLNEDGTVDKKALKKALEALKTEKPFLVKEASGDNGNQGAQGASGANVGANSTKTKKVADEEALRKKYPSLMV